MWVSPFRHLRVVGYLLLAAAFRSLSRLSSALSAKAFTLCPFSLNLFPRIALRGSFRLTLKLSKDPLPGSFAWLNKSSRFIVSALSYNLN